MPPRPLPTRFRALARLLRRGEVRALARVVRRLGSEAWIVGGAVRDACLGLPVREIDVAVAGDAESIARALEAEGAGRAVFLSRDRPGPRVFRVAGSRPLDIAELEGGSIETDLGRRDFTVNAIAVAVAGRAPEIVDPFGASRISRAGVCGRSARRTSRRIPCARCGPPGFSRPMASRPIARRSPRRAPRLPASQASRPSASGASSSGFSAPGWPRRRWPGPRAPASCPPPSTRRFPGAGAPPWSDPSPRSTTAPRGGYPRTAGAACAWRSWRFPSAWRDATPGPGLRGGGCRAARPKMRHAWSISCTRPRRSARAIGALRGAGSSMPGRSPPTPSTCSRAAGRPGSPRACHGSPAASPAPSP